MKYGYIVGGGADVEIRERDRDGREGAKKDEEQG
jgi:hypothetical protein